MIVNGPEFVVLKDNLAPKLGGDEPESVLAVVARGSGETQYVRVLVASCRPHPLPLTHITFRLKGLGRGLQHQGKTRIGSQTQSVCVVEKGQIETLHNYFLNSWTIL